MFNGKKDDLMLSGQSNQSYQTPLVVLGYVDYGKTSVTIMEHKGVLGLSKEIVCILLPNIGIKDRALINSENGDLNFVSQHMFQDVATVSGSCSLRHFMSGVFKAFQYQLNVKKGIDPNMKTDVTLDPITTYEKKFRKLQAELKLAKVSLKVSVAEDELAEIMSNIPKCTTPLKTKDRAHIVTRLAKECLLAELRLEEAKLVEEVCKLL
jgi:hypothetical protein